MITNPYAQTAYIVFPEEIPKDVEKQIVDEYEINEKVYDDLNGTEYKNMELDREREIVMVTYIENGEERTKEFPMQHHAQKE